MSKEFISHEPRNEEGWVCICGNPRSVSDREWAFVTMLLLHLDTVRRASRAGLFITLEGLQADICDFLSFPIPKTVWQTIKPFQDKAFIELVEEALRD